MSTTNTNQAGQAFTRLQVPDPATNAAIQDIYNKFAQVQQQIVQLQQQIAKLS